MEFNEEKVLGIIKDEFGWRQVLEQEGLLFEVVTDFTNLTKYDAIILNDGLDSKELGNLKDFLYAGGSILTDFPNMKALNNNFTYQRERVRYLIPEPNELFHSVGILDLETSGYNCPSGRLFEETYGKGTVLALGFEVSKSFLDTRSKPKPFYYHQAKRRFPYETCALVTKSNLRRLIVNCLRYLYKKIGKNYSHLWYYPEDNLSYFAFRVDTDFSELREIENTYWLSKEFNLTFTWFINTKTNVDFLTHFQKYKEDGQEIQLHCYQHNVFSDYERNFSNIKTGKEIMTSYGLEPMGFAAPFGEWNENLAQVLEDLNFRFSSEFTLSYDDLPFYPAIKNRQQKVLQIPIHPIGIGRLLRAGLAESAITDYYLSYIELRKRMNEPIILYDHPHRISAFSKIYEKVFKKIKETKGLWKTTFTGIFEWWQKRTEALRTQIPFTPFTKRRIEGGLTFDPKELRMKNKSVEWRIRIEEFLNRINQRLKGLRS